MDRSVAPSRIFAFGQFEARVDLGKLLKQGREVSLQDQPFRLLVALLERPGRVVSRQELKEALWPSGLVEFDKGLDVAMAKLRQALGDDSSNPRFIETLPKRGYRFIAPLNLIDPPVAALSGAVDSAAPSALDSQVAPKDATQPAIVAKRNPMIPRSIALAAVVGATIGIGWYWYAHREPPLAARAAVLVEEFSNATGDMSFDRSLRTAAIIDLGQSPYLTVVSDEKIGNALQRLGRPPDDRLEPAIARQVCQQEHAAATVSGSIQRVGLGYLLSLAASRCSDGSILATVGFPVADKEHVVIILGKAIAELRRKFGESNESLNRYDVTVVQATTNSLEALKAYQLGMELRSHTRNLDAIAAFKTSIALDSNFAIAYAQLGSCFSNLDEIELATRFFQKAFELREHATEPERLYIAGRYFDIVTGEMERGAAIYKLWTEIYPNDWLGYNALSNDANMLGRYDLAAKAAEHAVALEPDHAYGYTNQAVALLGLNRLKEGLQVAREAFRRGRDGGVLHSVLFSVALINDDQPSLERERDWAAAHPDEFDIPDAEAQAAEAQGQIKKSGALFFQLADRARRLSLPGYAQIILAQEAFYDLEMGQRVAALNHIQAADELGSDEFALELSALVYARLGNSAKAQTLVDEVNRRFTLSTFNISVFGPTIRTAMAMSSKLSAADVSAMMRPAESYEMGRQAVLIPTYIRSKAFLQSGAAAEAEHEFQKIIDHRAVDATSPLYPLAFLGLARALVLQGRLQEGSRAYESLMEQWKAADADLPVLLQAKREYQLISRQ